jgi:hypothetical protein
VDVCVRLFEVFGAKGRQKMTVQGGRSCKMTVEGKSQTRLGMREGWSLIHPRSMLPHRQSFFCHLHPTNTIGCLILDITFVTQHVASVPLQLDLD